MQNLFSERSRHFRRLKHTINQASSPAGRLSLQFSYFFFVVIFISALCRPFDYASVSFPRSSFRCLFLILG